MEQPLPLGGQTWWVVSFWITFYMQTLWVALFFFEVDFHYPCILHPTQIELPFAPQKIKINQNWLSWNALLFGLKTYRTAKLVEDLFDKPNIVCFFRSLQFWVKEGFHRNFSWGAAAQAKQLARKIHSKTLFNEKGCNFSRNLYQLISNT